MFIAACAGPRLMKPLASPPSLAAPADKALVVFIRPGSWASGERVVIVNEFVTFIGQPAGEEHFAVTVTPGAHTFVAWGANADGMRVSVLAGKTYFVEVRMKMGPGFVPAVHLLALKPTSEGWGKREAWLRETKPMTQDGGRGQAYIGRERLEVDAKVRQAMRVFAQYNPGEVDARTLVPIDGIP